MRIMLCRSEKIGSRIIRWMTGSVWSHAALIADDGRAIEAVWPRVRMTTPAKIANSHTAYTFVDIYCQNEQLALDHAFDQIGRPYDITALFGWLTGRDWQEEDSWFCSELVAWAFAQGGSPLFREGTLSRVTPQHLWMLRP